MSRSNYRCKSTQQEDKYFKKVKKYLATIDAVGRKIPDCGQLVYEYTDFWIPDQFNSYDDANECISNIKKDIRINVGNWLKNTNDKDIIIVVKTLRPVTRKALLDILPSKYHNFFRFDYGEMPNDLAAPTPFLCINRNQGNWIPIKKPIIRRYGSTTIEIKGVVLTAYDGQVTIALLQLRKQKKCKYTKKNISYVTRLVEIAKTLQASNPWSHSVLDAIWSSLQRLRKAVITITNKKGKRRLGGIIDRACKIEEDDNLDLEIVLDRTLIDLIDVGCATVDPDIYFNLPPKASNLYVYLRRQLTFNRGGYLKPIGIDKIYYYAGLGGIDSNKKSLSLIKSDLKKTLDQLVRAGVVYKYGIIDGKLQIFNDKIDTQDKQPKEKTTKYRLHSVK